MQNWIAETISPQAGFARSMNFSVENFLLLGTRISSLLALLAFLETNTEAYADVVTSGGAVEALSRTQVHPVASRSS